MSRTWRLTFARVSVDFSSSFRHKICLPECLADGVATRPGEEGDASAPVGSRSVTDRWCLLARSSGVGVHSWPVNNKGAASAEVVKIISWQKPN